MTVLDRKLGRELRASGWLLTAIAAIIIVGVACYISLGSCYRNLTGAKQRYYDQCRMADFSIELKKAPWSDLARVAELPGVADVTIRIQSFVTVDLNDVIEPLNGLVLSIPDRPEPVLNDILLRQGGYFTDRRRNEVIVHEAFAREHDLKPGDWIHLILNNRRQELLIVGTAISSEFVYMLGPGAMVPDPEHFGAFYLKQSFAEDVFDFDGAANQVLGRLAKGHEHEVREILDRAEAMLQPYGVFTTTPLEDQPSNKSVSQEIEGLRSMAVLMPCIFLAVAATVLNVLLTRLAEQQRTTVGTLKALGYRDRQVFFHFLKFGLAVGLAGGLAGAILGHLLSMAQTRAYQDIFEFPDLRAIFYPGMMLTAVSLSLVCALAGSLRGTRSVLRLKPAEAMRPKPPRKGHAIVLERIDWLWTRLSTGWRMVLRSVFRNHVRSAVGAFAAMMGTAILVSGLMMAAATPYLIDFQFKWITQSDFDLTFHDEQGREAIRELQLLPGVDRVEPLLNVACTFIHGPRKKKGGITGILPDATMTTPRDIHARPIRIPSSGLAMSRKLADLLAVEPGDWITVRMTKGLQEEHQVQVVEVSNSYMGTPVHADIRFLSRLLREEFVMTGAQLAAAGSESDETALFRELKRLPALQGISSRRDLIASIDEILIEAMMIFITCLVLFSGVVYFGSILNASLISLAERQTEVATLQVLGYGPWQIGSMLLRESLIVTLVGTLLGMPLGYLLTILMAISFNSEMFRLPVISTPGTWLVTLTLAVVFTLLAHLFVQRSIHRMDWLAALQAKE